MRLRPVLGHLLAASALSILLGSMARAQLLPCDTLDQSSARAPEFVRDYLERTKGSFVRVCGGGEHPNYIGASSVTKNGKICRYSDYELNLTRTNPPRLERTIGPPQTYMRLSEFGCPSPKATSYAATNNVPPNIFEHVISVWQDATSSPESFDKALSGTSDAGTLQRLRNVIAHGNGNRLAVEEVVAERGFWIWAHYRIEVADPDHTDRFYAVAVSSWIGRTYAVSSVSSGIY